MSLIYVNEGKILSVDLNAEYRKFSRFDGGKVREFHFVNEG